MSADNNHATGAKYGTPGLQIMRTIALERLNYSPDTINDAPFGQLYWDILSSNELNGGSKIIEGDLAKGLAALDAMNEEDRKASA